MLDGDTIPVRTRALIVGQQQQVMLAADLLQFLASQQSQPTAPSGAHGPGRTHAATTRTSRAIAPPSE